MNNDLPIDGERFIPDANGMKGIIKFEHLHRYAFALQFVENKVVLDIASGEGYGSNLIAKDAQHVYGVDINGEAVHHAQKAYPAENLQFLVGECEKIPLEDDSIDVAISFETIEHIESHDKFLEEIKRVLKADGTFLISSPNRKEYSDETGYENPFHCNELYFEEFEKLLDKHFNFCSYSSQRVAFGSMLFQRGTADQSSYGTFMGDHNQLDYESGLRKELYFLAVCSNNELPKINYGLFEDPELTQEAIKFIESPAAEANNLAQLYIPDAQNNITEALSYSSPLKPNEWQKLSFFIEPNSGISKHGFRFDPSKQIGEIKIRSYRFLRTDTEEVLQTHEHFEDATVTGTSVRIFENEGPLSLISYGEDPQCIFPASSLPEDAPLKVEILIFYSPEIPPALLGQIIENDWQQFFSTTGQRIQNASALEMQIAAVHNELVQRDQSITNLQNTIRERDSKISTLQNALNASESIVEQRNAKIAHMQKSFSWRATAPIRLLRRKLFPVPSPKKMPSIHLDHQPNSRSVNGSFSFRGWVIDQAENPRRRIFARVGERMIEARIIERDDVNCALSLPEGQLALGFDLEFRTGIGPKKIAIQMIENSGAQKTIFSKLYWVANKSSKPTNRHSYESWIERIESNQTHIEAPKDGPLISILLPVYNTPERWLKKCIDSVIAQTYTNWQLCIANDQSSSKHIQPILDAYAKKDPRIQVIHRTENGHISAASNSALSLAEGSYCALLDHDDEFAQHALAEIAHALIASPELQIIYSDEDKIDESGKRFSPYFKPDWNPELLRGQNYFCHLSVYSTELLRSIGGSRVGFEGAQDWDLALRASEQVRADQIGHIPKILYHWRAIKGSTALSTGEKSYHEDAAYKALKDHLDRTGTKGTVLPVKGSHWRIQYTLPETKPKVSVIIPTKNGLSLLKPCLTALLNRTTYPNYEVLIVDNGSDDPATLEYLETVNQQSSVHVIRDDGPFNYSAINNRAVESAKGEIIALLNNDIEPITPEWLDEMVAQAIQPRTGAVGAMLYYPNDTVQHAGVVLGISGNPDVEGVAGHAFKHFPRGSSGYINRMRLAQNYSAVTAACLVIKKSIFEEVGGLDKEHLAVSFNDVDFCLRVQEAGYRNVWTPFAELYHHESASRGKEDTPQKQERAKKESSYMRTTWGPLLDKDPAYNPNLTFVQEDFSFNFSER